ncbi:MAG: cation:proton antiporter [Candidatus Omnitrophica bacterium]|nr:cation:proton antiporter [Candidatus Omnitrophota bacterium]
MNSILSLGFILVAGLLSAKVIKKAKFPAVTAYLMLGIIIGPSILKLVSGEVLGASSLISNVVLGIIAFGIGENFSRENFRRVGASVVWISILEACGAWILVTLVFLFILKQPFYISLLFGAIASATAPAATIMVIREYQSKGVLTDTLMGVVAIDDAWCLIIFAVSLAISQAIFAHIIDAFSIFKVFMQSVFNILGAFILGGAAALALSYFSRFIRTQTELLIYTLGCILSVIGIALWLDLSVLLANMFLGAVLVNSDRSAFKFFESLKTVDPPLFLLFFVLAGANLELALMPKLGLLGLTYLVVRVAGKLSGASIGAHISHATSVVKKYLGWGLIPQAGVALGCALIAKGDFPIVGDMIFTTIVATTVVYELFGPLCTRYALHKAGEVATEHTK